LEVSGAFGEDFGVWLEKPIRDNLQLRSEAPQAGSQLWAKGRLALGLAVRVACLLGRSGWSGTRTVVRGQGG